MTNKGTIGFKTYYKTDLLKTEYSLLEVESQIIGTKME